MDDLLKAVDMVNRGEKAYCKKCGFDRADVRYCEGGFKCRLFRAGLYVRVPRGFDRNHLEYACQRCDYTWGEVPADSEDD